MFCRGALFNADRPFRVAWIRRRRMTPVTSVSGNTSQLTKAGRMHFRSFFKLFLLSERCEPWLLGTRFLFPLGEHFPQSVVANS